MLTTTEITHFNWNVQSGGFADYNLSSAPPERGPQIQGIIQQARTDYGVTNASLVDTHRWDDYYDGEDGIAAYTGFAATRYTRLGDSRLSQDGGEGIGIAMVTDHPIGQTDIIDMVANSRRALGVALDIGRYGLYMVTAYFDDLSEDVRLRQMNALLDQLPSDMPIAISGDINTQPANAKGAGFRDKLANLAVRSMCLLPIRQPVLSAIRDMNRRQVLPLAEKHGFTSADRTKQATAPSRLRLLTIDHVLHNDQVTPGPVEVITSQAARQASDHAPQVVKFRI